MNTFRREMSKKVNSPLYEVPNYEGTAIYALVGTSGKRYIGSCLNLKNRMLQHKTHMKQALVQGHDGFLNPKLEEAIQNGEKFRCEIIAQINADLSQRELHEIERIFLKHFGGVENTYNYAPIKHHY